MILAPRTIAACLCPACHKSSDAGASRIVATLSSALLLVLLFRRGDMADSPPFHGSIAAAGSPLRASRGSDLEVDWAIEDWRCGLRGVVMRWWPSGSSHAGCSFPQSSADSLGSVDILVLLGAVHLFSSVAGMINVLDRLWLVGCRVDALYYGVVWSAYDGLVGWWCPSLCSQEGSDQRGTLSKGAELHPAELEQSGMCEEGSEACSGLPSFHNWDCDWK